MSSRARVLVFDDRMPMLKRFLRLVREKFVVTTPESSSDALTAFDPDEPVASLFEDLAASTRAVDTCSGVVLK